jgi:glycerol-3-phosphate dehydrogenase
VHSERLSATEIYSTLPFLRSAGLLGAQVYVDCQTDDARLVLENVLDARAAGAAVASYLEIESVSARRSVRDVNAVDRLSGERFAIQARLVVNATGPFCDSFSEGPRRLRPTKGVHMIVDAERVQLGGHAVVLHSPRDGRLMFALPAGPRALIGTTDTDWRAPDHTDRPPRPTDSIHASIDDVDYLLEAANHAFPPAQLQREDVIGTIAGLRPLIASGADTPSATSREHEIWVDPRGVLSVAGGKITTMRSMAEQVVDRAADIVMDRGRHEPVGPCQTRTRPFPGAGESAVTAALPEDVRAHLLRTYGARATQVAALIDEAPSLARRLDPQLPYIAAELLFAIRFDLACEVDDVLHRRVPLVIESHNHGIAFAPEVARLLAQEGGLSGSQAAACLARFADVAKSGETWRATQSLPP